MLSITVAVGLILLLICSAAASLAVAVLVIWRIRKLKKASAAGMAVYDVPVFKPKEEHTAEELVDTAADDNGGEMVIEDNVAYEQVHLYD